LAGEEKSIYRGEEWRRQDRLRHLFLPNNRRMIGEFRAVADRHRERLLKLCGETERSDRLVRTGGAGSQ
jgi:hypothetical protein